MELERSDHLDDRLEDDAQRAQRRIHGLLPDRTDAAASRSGPYPHVDGLTGIHTANIVSYGQFDRNRNVTAATLTRYADHFAGKSHEFKFGFEFERSKIRNESGYPGGRYYYDYGGPYQVYLWNGYVTNATAKRTSLYAQDTWTLSDRLTANLGLRLDVNRGSVPTGTVLSNHALAPRAGLAFDVTGDHQTVVRANWGRYYDALFGGQFEFMDLSQQSTKITAAVLGPNRFQELNRTTPSTNVGIDPNIRQSHTDQFLAGIERQLFPDFSLTAQYINRRFRDFMGFIDTGSVYAPVQKVDPGPDGKSGTADDGQALTVYNLTNPGHEFKLFTNPANAFRDYDGFQLIGTKRYSNNWQASLSYTWSKRDWDGQQHGRHERGRDVDVGPRSDRRIHRSEPRHQRGRSVDVRLLQPGQAGRHLSRAGVWRVQRQHRVSLHDRHGRGPNQRGFGDSARATRRSASNLAAHDVRIRSTTSTSASRKRSRSARDRRSGSISTSSTSITRA